MDREEAQKVLELIPYIEFIQALAIGDTIQYNSYQNSNSDWGDIHSPTFDHPPERYRIKPEPREYWLSVESGGAPVAWLIRPTNIDVEVIHVREVLENES